MRQIAIACSVAAVVCAIAAGVLAKQNAALRQEIATLERVRAVAQDGSTQLLGCLAHIKAHFDTLNSLSGPLAERNRQELHRRITDRTREAEKIAREIAVLAQNPRR